jgi:hypothetical protein
VVLSLLPTSRPYTLWKLQALFHFGGTSSAFTGYTMGTSEAPLPQEPPSEFRYAWAHAILKGDQNEAQTRDALLRLQQRFPQRPEVYASLLRNQMKSFPLGREEEVRHFRGGDSVRPANPESAQRVLEWAQRGETLDPENAFFTGMRLRALLALRRDKEALSALQQAAQKAYWNDYLAKQAEAEIAYWRERHGRASGDTDIVITVAVLFPHLASERAVARVFMAKAWQLEQQGRSQDALQIRIALARYAQRMVNEQNTIRTLVGIAIIKLAASEPPDKTASTAEQRYQRFLKRLETQGFTREARWFRAELERVQTISERIRQGMEVFVDRHLLPAMQAYYIQLLAILVLQGLALLWGVTMILLWVAQRKHWKANLIILSVLVAWLLTATWFVLSSTGALMADVVTAIEAAQQLLSVQYSLPFSLPQGWTRWGLPIGTSFLGLAFISLAVLWAVWKGAESPEAMLNRLQAALRSLTAWALIALVVLLVVHWRADRQLETAAQSMRENEVGLLLRAAGFEPTLPPPTDL